MVLLSSGTIVPFGWEETIDENTGNLYFFNISLGETSWTPPVWHGTVEENEAANRLQTWWKKYCSVTTTSESFYKTAVDPISGHPYYYNTLTKETTWTKPQEIDNTLPPGWTSAVDPSTQHTYYYSASTGETSWSKPSLEKEWAVRAPLTENEAAVMIQHQWRFRKAWKKLLKMMYAIYEKRVDADGIVTYVNTKTGASSYEKPKLCGSGEFDPLSIAEEEEEGSEEKDIKENLIDEENIMEIKKIPWKAKGDKTRKYPRSKMQLMVDEVEDQLKRGKRIEVLDFTNFKAPKLSSRVWNLECLETLCIENNQLTRLPSGIQDLINLTNLNVSGNALTKLPACMQTMTGLLLLNASGNQIVSFSAKLWKMESLTHLNLSHNKMVKLPSIEGDLELLKETGEWTVTVGLLKDLTWLSIGSNELIEWPDGIEKCTLLTHLDVSCNQVTTIPNKSVSQLIELEMCDISNNSLVALPDDIGACLALVDLYAHCNQIENIPSSIGQLIQLKKLHLFQNQIVHIPSEVNALRCLQELLLYDNQYTKLPDHMFSTLTSLTTCTLSKSHLNELKSNVFISSDERLNTDSNQSMVSYHLEHLDLSRNSLLSIPALMETSLSTCLLALTCTENQLTCMPSLLTTFSKLETLCMDHNNIVHLPEEGYAGMKNLTLLNLSHNHIITVPSALVQLPLLTILHLEFNNIRELPVEMGKLVLLQELYIGKNSLKNLPTSFTDLKKLRILDARCNALTSIPACLRILEERSGNSLHYINFSNNPFFPSSELSNEIENNSKSQNENNHYSSNNALAKIALASGLQLLQHNQNTQAHDKLSDVLNVLQPFPWKCNSILGSTIEMPLCAIEAYFYRGLTRCALLQEKRDVYEMKKKVGLKMMGDLYSLNAHLHHITKQLVKLKSKKSLLSLKDDITLTESKAMLLDEMNEIKTSLVSNAIILNTASEGMIELQEGAYHDLTIAILYHFEIITSYLSRASVSMQSNKFNQAIDDYSTVLQLCPLNTDVLIKRSLAFEKCGQIELALFDVKKALFLKPYDEKYSIVEAILLEKQDLFYIPARLNKAKDKRSYFMDSEGTYTRYDTNGNFEKECLLLIKTRNEKERDEKRNNQKEKKERNDFQRSFQEIRNEIHFRIQMDIEETDQHKREEIISREIERVKIELKLEKSSRMLMEEEEKKCRMVDYQERKIQGAKRREILLFEKNEQKKATQAKRLARRGTRNITATRRPTRL